MGWSRIVRFESTKARPPSSPREGTRHVREPRVPSVVVHLRARMGFLPTGFLPMQMQVGRRLRLEAGRTLASMPFRPTE